MELLLIKEGLSNIKNFEISIIDSSNSILVQNIDLEFYKFGIRLTCDKVGLKNNSNKIHIIDKILISINLDVIYKRIIGQNDNLPILYLYVDGFDIISASNRGKSIYNKNYNILFTKIMKSLNRENINNFQLEVNCKNYNIATAIGNIKIEKISFENAALDKRHLGILKFNYILNNQRNSLYGFLHKPDSIDNIFDKLDKNSDNKLVLEFYGYIDSSIKMENYVMHPKEFYRTLITYNMDHNDLEFAVDLRLLDLHINNMPPIITSDIRMLSSYNLVDKTFYIKKLEFDLISGDKKIPIEGNGSINHDGDLDIRAMSNSLIDKETIYSLWPNLKGKQKEFLQSLISDTKINKPVISIRANKKFNNQYNLDDLQLDFKLKDTVLKQHIKGYQYRFDIKDAYVSINLNNIGIKADNLYIDRNIPINNLKISIPLDITKRALFDFELDAVTNNTYKALNRYLDNLELLSGNIKAIIHSELPMMAIDLKDLLLSGQISTDRLNLIFNNKEREFSTKGVIFALKDRHLSCMGDIKYNNIELQKLQLLSRIYQDNLGLEKIKLESASFKINLNQEKVQNMIERLQSEIKGTLGVQVLDYHSLRLNLDEIAISRTPVNFRKQKGVPGELDLVMDSEEKFRNIHLKLPEIEATGDCDITGNKLIALDLKFKRLYNSSFNITYSDLDNIYKIDASIIDLEDIQMIIDNINSDRAFLKKRDIFSDEEINLVINAERILLQKIVLLENLSLKLNLRSGNIVKIDGYGYAKDKNGYVRIFFDSPVFALIINNLGYLTDAALNLKTINKGNLALYLSIPDLNIDSQAMGDLYLYNFKLLKSYLLSTILKIYALSGFSVKNIFQMFNNGINFSNMHCNISSNNRSMLFDNCQAFSDAMLLNAEAKLDLKSYSGELQGLIIPKNFLNAPIIFLQQILSRKGKTLLDDMQDRQNFSITWNANSGPIIQTNPISFILPIIFNNFFSKKKTVRRESNN